MTCIHCDGTKLNFSIAQAVHKEGLGCAGMATLQAQGELDDSEEDEDFDERGAAAEAEAEEAAGDSSGGSDIDEVAEVSAVRFNPN